MAPSNTELNSLFNAVAQHEGLQHPLPATTLARHRSKLSSATAGASTQTLQEVSATVAAYVTNTRYTSTVSHSIPLRSLAQRYDVTGEQDLSDSLDASLGRLLMASQLDEGTLRVRSAITARCTSHSSSCTASVITARATPRRPTAAPLSRVCSHSCDTRLRRQSRRPARPPSSGHTTVDVGRVDERCRGRR